MIHMRFHSSFDSFIDFSSFHFVFFRETRRQLAVLSARSSLASLGAWKPVANDIALRKKWKFHVTSVEISLYL